MSDAERSAINNIRASIEQMVEASRGALQGPYGPNIDTTDSRTQMTLDAWRRLGVSGFMVRREV